MAMHARAKWMTTIIAEVFKLTDYDVVDVFRQFQQQFDDFYKGVGPNRIFIYNQPTYKINDGGEV